MNKTAIKNFAIWARNKLIADISYKAGLLGITEKEVLKPTKASTADVLFFNIGTEESHLDSPPVTGAAIAQRKRLTDRINEKSKHTDYATAYKTIIEEVAYTWFNRLIAIRFMEVNEYLPSRVRVLSSASGKIEPDIVTTPFETDLTFSTADRKMIIKFKDENKLDELFRMLFVKQCNALNSVLPELFEEIDDYSELLLNISFTDKDGVVYRLVHGKDNDIITEDDFKEAVEIIGWLYQYYNTEPKIETFALLKENIKITKERIPAATQLFTPNWIVRYMVENSLGRIWIEGHPNNNLKANWKYYLDEAEQTPEVQAQLEQIRIEYRGMSPEDITFLDPCMGSGHILVYAFDVFMQIYESAGYSQRDAARLILENNLFGLDIDKRAYQLAYFALFMKARQYNRRIFDGEIAPQVYHPGGWQEGEEFGSLIKIDRLERKPEESIGQQDMFNTDYKSALRIWNFKRLLSENYEVVVTNPPYMGGSGMNGRLVEFVKKNYPDSKSDLFSTFIERCNGLACGRGINAMITQHSWMFLSSYEKLRLKLKTLDIVNMVHLGARSFVEIGGEVVQSTTFTLRNCHITDYKGTYIRLVDFNNADQKEQEFLSGNNRYIAVTDNFSKIPGSPISYWASENFLEVFEKCNVLSEVAKPRKGLDSADNDRFVRFWFEPIYINIFFNAYSNDEAEQSDCKWFPLNSGGAFRKWYGNNEKIIDWQFGGKELRSYPKAYIRNKNFYFMKGITWTKISSSKLGVRLAPIGFIFDSAGQSLFPKNSEINYILGLLCSIFAFYLLNVLNPTLNYQVGDLERVPIRFEESRIKKINTIVEANIAFSRTDWDSFEASWDFKRHPLV
ncbi:MAG: BREX-1 system adenine-specific DNA-methyltransferase PglX [Oscillospiraceae bacterium]|jgi:hypothetical protein|nr:BREX-1 system adenine-specific DNA-methyltransferase PglX [Oscillospiraceae bacterium]